MQQEKRTPSWDQGGVGMGNVEAERWCKTVFLSRPLTERETMMPFDLLQDRDT